MHETGRGPDRAGAALVALLLLFSSGLLAVHVSTLARALTHRLERAPTVMVDPGCRRRDNPPTSATIPPDDPWGPFESDDSGDDGSSSTDAGAELQRLYAVHDGALQPHDGVGGVRDCDRQLWQLVQSVADPATLGSIDELLVFDSSTGVSDDGVYIGAVDPMAPHDAAHWRLSIAPNDLDEVMLAIDVAHEIGHLRTIGADQLDTSVPRDECDTWWTGEGCLRDGTTLVEFLSSTWSHDEVDEWFAATDDDHTDDEVTTALHGFYDHHSGDFLTDHAASSPVEDVAESFAYWCVFGVGNPATGDYVDGSPGDAAAKLAWMDDPAHGVSGQYAARCAALRALTR